MPLAVVEAIVGHSSPAMTRHYTHIGEGAAGLAVAALPTVIGEAPPAPSVNGDGPAAILAKLRGILEEMAVENWVQKRREGLTLLGKAVRWLFRRSRLTWRMFAANRMQGSHIESWQTMIC